VYAIKYCSTFDSTTEGNIGPSMDAALDELGESFTVALPALPVNGRTTYMGYHFVHEQLLSDSPMRHHPLTPMTNPNLVSHLQTQTRRKVGLVSHPVVRRGAVAVQQRVRDLRVEGTAIAVLDCVSEEDLAVLCAATADLRVITGSSAPGIKLPELWKRNGWWHPRQMAAAARSEKSTSGCLIIAGSCSTATQGQKQWWTGQGNRTMGIDPIDLVTGEIKIFDYAMLIVSELQQGRSILVETASSRSDVERVHEWAAQFGRTPAGIGLSIAHDVAELCGRVFEEHVPAGLIVAGGETSTAICRALDLGALRIGVNIDPGVPLCESLGRYRLPVVLKSGNFGTPDFFGKAEAAIYRGDIFASGQ
jgi:uncharacterized protein YgbK (DUF1537 family)